MASIKSEGEDEGEETRLQAILYRLYATRDWVLNAALLPLRVLISKPAQKFYLGSFLFATGSVALLFLSTLAFVLFYWNYVPAISLERRVYLQFGNDHHPVGTTSIPPSILSSSQPYDITIALDLPRSPPNLAAGNFMLDLQLLSYAPIPSSSPSSQAHPPQPPPAPSSQVPSHSHLVSSSIPTFNPPGTQEFILHVSRRPAILTYRSPLVNIAKTLLSLGLHVTGWTMESEVVEVKMFEGVEFAGGWRNVPSAVRVRVETLSAREVEIYGVTVKFGAKLGGLRYILHTFPLTSALFFITAIYLTSLTSALVVWLLLTLLYSAPTSSATPSSTSPRIKRRSSSAFSDTPRSFPTFSSQPPLRYLSQPLTPKSDKEEEEERGRRIKLEEEDEIARADVEDFSDTDVDLAEAIGDEDLLAWRDSGIGTGVETERFGMERERRKKGGRGR